MNIYGAMPKISIQITSHSEQQKARTRIQCVLAFLLAAKPHRHFSFHPTPEHAGKPCHIERLGYVLVHASILGTDDVFGEGIRRHG